MTEKLPFSYKIRRSQRVVNARIVVKPGCVEVVAPANIPEQRLHHFVQTKRQWIIRSIAKMNPSIVQTEGFAPRIYQTGEALAYLGRRYPITLIPSKLKRAKVEFDEGYRVYVPEATEPDGQQKNIKEAVIRWMKKQTKTHVEHFVATHAHRQQLFPRSILVKTQKSRWGSCGIHNDINLNWLLIMAPNEVLEYVVVHELCHIKIKNHSSQFWSLVGEHLPDYQQRRQWLKKNGRSLMMAFSPEAN